MISSIKIIIIGDSGVGKSSLLYSYLNNKPCLYPISSISLDCQSKKIKINNNLVNLIFWDTVGQESFLSITKSYYRNSQIAILVYSVDDLQSFTNLTKWIDIINQYNTEPVLKVIVGDKIDSVKKRQVDKKEAEEFAQNNDMLYFELTQNDPVIVRESIAKIVKSYIDNIEEYDLLGTPPENNSEVLKISKVDSYGECCF